MAWTAADLALYGPALKAAIARGQLSISISSPAGSRTVAYASLTEMRAVLAEMERDAAGEESGVTSTYRLAQHSKGLTT